jgi:hypothetical protein
VSLPNLAAGREFGRIGAQQFVQTVTAVIIVMASMMDQRFGHQPGEEGLRCGASDWAEPEND